MYVIGACTEGMLVPTYDHKPICQRATALATALGLVLLVSGGCADERGKRALPEHTRSSPTIDELPTLPPDDPDGPSESPSQPSPASSPLADVDPCSLMTEEAAAAVDITDISSGEPRQVGTSRTCRWHVEKETAAASSVVVIGVDDTYGTRQMNPDVDRTPVTIGKRRAVRSLGDFSCSVLIDVGDRSHVLVQFAGTGEITDCPPALKLARLIEPELPDG
ncbi:MAG TPA: DUF3558 family protein [Actinopolymorphaceae bacterium]